jgi:hypothetical protein
MKAEIFLDRGNGGSKVLPVVEGEVRPAFKIPSITRQVKGDLKSITFSQSGQSFLYGDDAIESYAGKRYSPLDENDKIKDLSVVVAAALAQVFPNGGPIELTLGVSSPIFYKGIEQEIIKELSKLTAGFSYGGHQYVVLLERVGAFQEGVIFLEKNVAFNGVIDLGQGTLLAGVRHPQNGVTPLPLSDGNIGGCNLIITALLSDERFLKSIKDAGFSAAPSPDRLSSLLSEGRWEVKSISFKKYLKPHMAIPKQRLENAAQAIKTELKNASPYEEVIPRIALIGGGSSLMQGVLGATLDKWCEHHNLELFPQLPDYQTVLQMCSVSKEDPGRLINVQPKVEA